MEDILKCCCGLDIHKESIIACLLEGPIEGGNKPSRELREFGTQLHDLLRLRSWLQEHACHHVAMESTGIYWQPVYGILEEALTDEMHLLVVNARHMKQIPGKKTDMQDAEWIATLLRAGLLKGSFVPERTVRNLRQYTRYRKALVRDIVSQKNRIEKLLQSSGFRLSSFLSDIFGASGWAIMQQLVAEGYITQEGLAVCLKGRAREKSDAILSSVNGTMSLSERRLLSIQLAHLQDLLDNLHEVETIIQEDFFNFEGTIELLNSIPGVSHTAAYAILAEIGRDMSAFPTAQHLCSWAGLAPGIHQSAGKKKKQRITHGNTYLKSLLCEVAWSVTRQRQYYLSEWYWRLKHRTDGKRALVALARKLLVIIYAMLKTNQPFDEQKFLERRELTQKKRVNRMVNELTRLGYDVALAS